METPIPTLSNLHNAALHSKLQAAIDNKTKPLGSLGRLEALAVQIGQILGTDKPVLADPQMVYQGLNLHVCGAYDSWGLLQKIQILIRLNCESY